jgi:hypothetical protein
MIEKLQHRVDVPYDKGERVSVPCDSDRDITVALVAINDRLAFPDRLIVLHRASGGKIIDHAFPPCDAGLERAKQACDELLALPVDWSHPTESIRTLMTSVEIHNRVGEIWRSAAIWVSNFWSMIDDPSDGEDE